MNYLPFILALMSLLAPCGALCADFEVNGAARQIRANGNRTSGIVAELRLLDLCGIVRTGEELVIRDVKLELAGDSGSINDTNMPRQSDLQFKCRFDVDVEPTEPRTRLMYEEYIRLRLNGLTSLGTLKILTLWYGPDDRSIDVRRSHMPVVQFERLDKIPEWLVKICNPWAFAKHSTVASYLFRDGDLVWLLAANEDDPKSCDFVMGLDGKHFNSIAFAKVFTDEHRMVGGSSITEAFSLQLVERLKKKWGVEWYSPLDIPLPGWWGLPK